MRSLMQLNWRRAQVSIAVLATLVLGACTAPPIIVVNPVNGPVQVSTSSVNTHPMRGEVQMVPGASAALVTDAGGITFTYNATELVPGNIYTTWVVIVNDPAACEDSNCPGSDVMGRSEMVHSDITYGDGQIADEMGRATFQGTIQKGDLPHGWFGGGLQNPRGAMVRLVLHDHGPPIEGAVDEMLATFRGGCTTESIPAHFPEAAFADGFVGENACIHYQVATFIQ